MIVDDGKVVFDSNAILLYLAEKTGKFMPSAAHRGEMLSWLMFIATGVGPYSGQAVHFKHFSPEKIAYAHNRYQFEAMRHYQVVDQHLANTKYMVGGAYSFATWRCGAGRAWCPSSLATRPGRSCRT